MNQAFVLLAFALIGGWISRVLGGGRPQLPRWVTLPAYALPYGAIFLGHPLGLLAMAAAAAGKATAHTPYWALGHTPELFVGRVPTLDPIVRFFFGPIERGGYWRAAFGLAVVGMAVTLVPGLLFAWYVSVPLGLLIVFSGALKPLGYMLGWKLSDYSGKTTLTPNVYGEFLAGVFGWSALALCFF